MTDDTNPFGTFKPDPAPTFEEKPQLNPKLTMGNTEETPAASPKRRSRRSRATPSAPSRPSRAPKAAEPAQKPTTPKRKYTRKKVGAEVAGVEFGPDGKPRKIGRRTGFAPELAAPYGSELDLVTEIVTKLRALDPKARARVTAAIGRLL